MWLIDYCQTHRNKTVSVVSESRPHLSKGASRDFLMIMQVHNYFKDDRWNKTDLIYEFETGTRLEFFSADQPGKVRGPRRDVLFLNEGNNISYEIFTQLEIRTKDIIWVDSNPTHEYWMYTEIIPKRDIDFITLTYKDNQALSQSIIDAIEARRDNKNWYQVYGLGELGISEARIHKNWQIIEQPPFEARLDRYGLDYGYSCLSGETEVETSKGLKRIDEIKENDFVLTRQGFRKVKWAGSRGVKNVYRLDFGNEKHIIVTGEHPIFTINGWKRVDELGESETICELKQSLKEKSIKDTQTVSTQTIFTTKRKKTERRKQKYCIERYIKVSMERFKKEWLFTTLMKTLSIMNWIILLQFQPVNTQRYTKILQKYRKREWTKYVQSMDLQKVTGKIEEINQSKQLGKKSEDVKSAVKKSFLPMFIRNSVELFVEKKRILGVVIRNIFANNAEKYLLHHHTLKEKPVLRNVRISRQLLKEKREVFDLTIEGEHEYFANGLLVHNCDPTAIDAIYRHNGGLIIDEILDQNGMSNKMIADVFLSLPRALVIADSAEPKSNDELRSYGISLLPSTKGPGSVNQGIQFVQDQRISVTKRSLNVLREYRNYLWTTDKDGKIINEPSPIWNNHMDAIRYAVTSMRKTTIPWKPNNVGGVKPMYAGMLA